MARLVGCWSLGLHLVVRPKYRHRIMGGLAAVPSGELLEPIAEEYGWQTVATEVMPDHLPLFVRVGPPESLMRRDVDDRWEAVS